MTRRAAYGLFVLGIGLLACSGSGALEGASGKAGPGGASAGTASTATTKGAAAPPSCPAGLPTPVQIAPDVNAANLTLAASSVFFRAATSVVEMGVDGSNATTIYTSPTMVSAFTDGKAIVSVEAPNPPDADLKLAAPGTDPTNAQDLGGADGLDALGAVVFGSDGTTVYAFGRLDGGDAIYAVGTAAGGAGDGGAPAGLTPIVQADGSSITRAQLVDGTIWYVLDGSKIYRLPASPATGVTPQLVATVDGGCSLAVTKNHLYCTTMAEVFVRDLSGAGAKKVGDPKTSKVPVEYSDGVAAGDALVVRSTLGAGALKSVLRVVDAGGQERVLACGREPIVDIVSDGTRVIWAESGRGVFALPLGP